MKKFALLLSICFVVLVGCTQETPSTSQNNCPAPIIYTFSGECREISLIDGRLTLNASTPCNEKETLDAGTLNIKEAAAFEDVTTISVTLYLTEQETRHALASVHRTSNDGTLLPIDTLNGPLGHQSGSTSLLGTKLLDGKALSDHFFLELIATHTDGTTTTYTVPLKVSKTN